MLLFNHISKERKKIFGITNNISMSQTLIIYKLYYVSNLMKRPTEKLHNFFQKIIIIIINLM